MSQTTTPSSRELPPQRCVRMMRILILFCLLLDVFNPFLAGVLAFEADDADAPIHRGNGRVGVAASPARANLPASALRDTSSAFARPLARSTFHRALLTVCLGHRDRGGAESVPAPDDGTASLVSLA